GMAPERSPLTIASTGSGTCPRPHPARRLEEPSRARAATSGKLGQLRVQLGELGLELRHLYEVVALRPDVPAELLLVHPQDELLPCELAELVAVGAGAELGAQRNELLVLPGARDAPLAKRAG